MTLKTLLTLMRPLDPMCLLTPYGRRGRVSYLVNVLVWVGFLVAAIAYWGPLTAGAPGAPMDPLVWLVGGALIAGVVGILSIQRAHDINKSAEYALGIFLPGVNVVFFLVFVFLAGDDGDNLFGSPPKDGALGRRGTGKWVPRRPVYRRD